MSHVLYFGLPQVFHLVEARNKIAKGSSTASRQNSNYGGSSQADRGLAVKDLGVLRLITRGTDEPELEPRNFGEAFSIKTLNIRR
ncbi:hypothetical protein FOC1_g10001256 [Fusarium oxysporum f. sp. cubense race 1]|uniref:Uncharacterized protein n=1 Tax=Fusarium oxysporum f. sp. cubense (strain race 1) TaxID=1229664 RepID=N4UCP7_FUSC1|nr:hypothetical protein FOC1_g10001256 [Fusarium oxysporum f. sp. cubense race 1]